MARKFKKVDGGHGHHGGAWKVAYADFVTAMMALFMVMWLLASTDPKSRKEISNYFRSGVLPDGELSMRTASQLAPSMIEETGAPPPQDPAHRTLKDDEEAAKKIGEKLNRMAALDIQLQAVLRNMRMTVTPDGVLIDMVDADDGLLFDLSSSKLREPMERFIRSLAPMVATLGRKIEINGHTDARPFPTGSKLSNWDLSYQRAAAAREIFESSGLPPDAVVGVFARGSSQLYLPAQPLAAQNRRLSFLIKVGTPAASSGDSTSPLTPVDGDN